MSEEGASTVYNPDVLSPQNLMSAIPYNASGNVARDPRACTPKLSANGGGNPHYIKGKIADCDRDT